MKICQNLNTQKSEEIDDSVLGDLSKISAQYLKNNRLDSLSSFDAILKEVKTLKESKINAIDQLLPKKGKSVIKGGVNMRLDDPFAGVLEDFGDVDVLVQDLVDNEEPSDTIPVIIDTDIPHSDVDEDTCYTMKLVANVLLRSSKTWYFGLGFKYYGEPVTIQSMNYSVTYTNNSVVHNGTSFNSLFVGNNLRTALFLGNVLNSYSPSDGLPILSGTITLSNGKTLSFNETLTMQASTSGASLHGSVDLTFRCDDDGNTTEEPTFGDIKKIWCYQSWNRRL